MMETNEQLKHALAPKIIESAIELQEFSNIDLWLLFNKSIPFPSISVIVRESGKFEEIINKDLNDPYQRSYFRLKGMNK